jgi:alkylated DNA repair dioxygenase AlkB
MRSFATRRVSGAEERLAGLVYRPEFVSAEEEQALVEAVGAMDFREVKMRGQTARRTVRHLGYDYDYEAPGRLSRGEPLPSSLLWLRDRCADFAELAPAAFAQALVSRYPAGAGIGWHRDAPQFGPRIVGVSLLSTSPMRFRRGPEGERRVYELTLGPRSAYLLSGAARSSWQHSIPATKALRYSITFRTLNEAAL